MSNVGGDRGVLAAPPALRGFIAAGGSRDAVALDWEALRDETDADTGTSFTDATDKGEKQYVYRVRAYNALGLSRPPSWKTGPSTARIWAGTWPPPHRRLTHRPPACPPSAGRCGRAPGPLPARRGWPAFPGATSGWPGERTSTAPPAPASGSPIASRGGPSRCG